MFTTYKLDYNFRARLRQIRDIGDGIKNIVSPKPTQNIIKSSKIKLKIFKLPGSASPSPLLLLLPLLLLALPLGGRRTQQWQLHSRPGQMGHWRWGRPLLAAAGNGSSI